jgi:hypothetical protein
VRNGLSRGFLETLFALTGLALVVADVYVPASENGLAAGMALITASGASAVARATRPDDKDAS